MKLPELLSAQQSKLQALISLMEEERQLLAVAQVDGGRIEEIAGEKQSLVGALNESEQQRRTLLETLGYPTDLEGARRAADAAGCLNEWLETRAATERAARLNELIGSMLGLRITHNQQMLDLIHAVAEKTLYDTRGRKGAQPGNLNTSA